MEALSAAQKSAYYAGTVPPAEQIRDGIYVIPLPMTGSSLPFSLCYAIEDSRGEVHLVDSGVDTDAAWQAFESGLAEYGHQIDDVASLTATHMHHDHFGLASRLRRSSGAQIRMHQRDAYVQAWLREELDEMLVTWGVPAPVRTQLAPALASIFHRAVDRGCSASLPGVWC
ncbi:MBL fold metallo-hydrolase [Microbacterium sp. BWT-B31]|uniref:MBL fold metallo-hydrolase n=1 Tax=Microbacterium sp. BWT-B31 TaxID=3232072 RepID=UPI0035296C7C